MFIIKCGNCGREQRWGDGVVVGQGTVIEVADRAVYCECGAGVEEENGEFVAIQSDPTTVDTTIPASSYKRELLQ